MSGRPFAPRINHVAISVDAALMDESGRAALPDFFCRLGFSARGNGSTVLFGDPFNRDSNS